MSSIQILTLISTDPAIIIVHFVKGKPITAGAGSKFGNTLDTTHTWGIAPRGGSAGIITDNNCVGDGYNRCVSLQIDSTCCKEGSYCGDGEGETTERSILKDSYGCRQAPENWYIWDNTCESCKEGEFGRTMYCDDGTLAEDKDYFLREPNSEQDGFSWTPFTYPHPLRSGESGEGSLKRPVNLRVVPDATSPESFR